MIRGSLDTSGWSAAIDQLGERAGRPVARALNRAAGSGRTLLSREIAEDMSLRVGYVRDRLTLRDAQPDQWRASVTPSGKRLPLLQFGARDVRPRGVSARVQGTRTRYRSAFIATMKSGHVGVFARKGKKRLPIQELFGPSIPHVFGKYLPAAQARAEEQLMKNMEHELQYALRDQ